MLLDHQSLACNKRAELAVLNIQPEKLSDRHKCDKERQTVRAKLL